MRTTNEQTPPADAGPVERPVRPQRWTAREAVATEYGGFVAWGDYMELERAAASLALELAEARADAMRFRTMLRNTGNEWTLATPGAEHKLQITLNCTGCEKYLPDGAVDFPGTIRAVLDDEQRIQDSWKTRA